MFLTTKRALDDTCQEPSGDTCPDRDLPRAELTKELHITRLRLANEMRDKRFLMEDISSLKQKLSDTAKDLKEMRARLDILIENRDRERETFEKQVLYHVKDLTLPFIEKLKKTLKDPEARLSLEIIEANINTNIGRLLNVSAPQDSRLTSTETRIATLIAEGRKTSEIAGLMCMPSRSIDYHRNSIRKKLGLTKREISLKQYLSSQ